MTRAYVLDPVTRATLGLVDQSWERLAYTRRYVGMDTFELAINRSRLWASELQTNRLLYLPDEGDRIFLIEQIASEASGSTRNDAMTVTGRSLEGIAMAERLVQPPVGESQDRQTAVAAETAMKHYVRSHAADLADVARQVPGLVVAPDGAAGATVTVAGRYQTVFDLVREIGLLAGIGWEITYDAGSDAFVFDIVAGVDRSGSVFFDFAFETLERTEELDSVLDSSTVAVVAGQGEGVARDIVTRWSGAEPEGFARREAFLDARDVELGATTILAQRGDAFLEAAASETRLEAGIHQYGAFRHGQHWDLGDLVLVRHAERDISYAARVVEVETVFERSAAAPTISAVIDRPFPTMHERVEGSGARGGAVDYPVGAAPSGSASGELAGTYPAPTVAAVHAGSAHHDRAHDHAAGGDGTALAPATVRLSSTTDVSLSSTGHAFQVGPSAGQNIAMDDNEIMARNNGAASPLHLNADGGGMMLGNNVTPTTQAEGITIGGDVNLFRLTSNILAIGAGDRLRVKPALSGDIAFDVHLGSEANTRFRLMGDGSLLFGDGTTTPDVSLLRPAANVLRTEAFESVGTYLSHTGFLRGGGTSFPASPTTNDRYYRTDLGMEFYWTGSRWVSTQTFHLPIVPVDNHTPFAATDSGALRAAVPPLAGCSDIWLQRVTTAFYVAGGSALSGSHNWVIALTNKRISTNTADAVSSLTVNSGTLSVWRQDDAAIAALMNNGTTHVQLETNLTKTGTPGDLYVVQTLTYRMVAT